MKGKAYTCQECGATCYADVRHTFEDCQAFIKKAKPTCEQACAHGQPCSCEIEGGAR